MSDIEDLQIFLGRPADDRHSGQSKTFLGQAPKGTRSLREATNVYVPTANNEVAAAGYVAIANSDAVEIVHFPFALSEVRPLVEMLATNRLPLSSCIDYGTKLFDFVFHRTIRDKYRHILRSENKNNLRVNIATDVPELVFVPWELMCDTKSGYLPSFLCYDKRIHLARSLKPYNRKEIEQNILGDEQELRVLLVTANPQTAGEINVEQEEQMLRFIIDEHPRLSKIKFDFLHHAHIGSLRQKIRDFKPHVVHMACHGGYDDKHALGYIVLESKDRSKPYDFVDAYRFASLLHEPGTVQLVFLNSCYGGFQEYLSPMSGIAQCLHAIGIPEVIALQFALLDTTAHTIVLNFYRYLLREGCAVESAVTHIRRHLLIDGFDYSESFGLVAYQANASFRWPHYEQATRIPHNISDGFRETSEVYSATMKNEILERLSPEIDGIRAIARDLDEMGVEDVLLLLKNFDDTYQGLEIVRAVVSRNLHPRVVLQMIRIVTLLSLRKLEKKLINTAIILIRDTDFKSYLQNKKPNKGVKWDLIDTEFKDIMNMANKANGERQALFIVPVNGGNVLAYLQELSDPEEADFNPLGLSKRWRLVCNAVKMTGCGFILPGDGRMKLVVDGEQLAECDGGNWKRANYVEIRMHISEIAASIKSPVLNKISEICFLATERRAGLLLAVQGKDAVQIDQDVDQSKNYAEILGLSNVTICEQDAESYLDKVKGDKAVVISEDGLTLACNAMIAVDSNAPGSAQINAGTRHATAERLTKATDAIAFVVSEDGPISICKEGHRSTVLS